MNVVSVTNRGRGSRRVEGFPGSLWKCSSVEFRRTVSVVVVIAESVLLCLLIQMSIIFFPFAFSVWMSVQLVKCAHVLSFFKG